ncbi:hypothetical protein WAK64_19595 [Bacillus spongiae]|uniref:Uncharacterized protein n=1 Tax=Bacillus spongiae TaxID=2683610 RepID=A0ABU8HJJ6_9BACI
MKLKHIFIVVLTSAILLLMGCSNTGIKEKDSEFPPTMTGQVIINGMEYQIEDGSYRWERKKGLGTEVVQTDYISPYQMADKLELISVSPNEKVDIRIEENPDIKVYLWNEEGREKEIKHNSNEFTLPANKGTYIYEVLAEWTNGEVSYTFVVDIR